MVIRIATFERKPAAHDNPALMMAFRAWLKSQPGFETAWHAEDSTTGRALSISVWKDMASLLAMKERTFPGGSMNIKPDKVEIFDHGEQF